MQTVDSTIMHLSHAICVRRGWPQEIEKYLLFIGVLPLDVADCDLETIESAIAHWRKYKVTRTPKGFIAHCEKLQKKADELTLARGRAEGNEDDEEEPTKPGYIWIGDRFVPDAETTRKLKAQEQEYAREWERKRDAMIAADPGKYKGAREELRRRAAAGREELKQEQAKRQEQLKDKYADDEAQPGMIDMVSLIAKEL